ncbi:MAG: class I SAM-dependent methyltransferase [Acidimicrobiia bacterium]|nr:class I SAM-dependent methyltransferase [Acidimicrobiia bacterium]
MKGTWPPRGLLPVTGPVDRVELYHRPIVGRVLRRRASWIDSVLTGRPPDNLLEVGYGSGILQPALARHAKSLYGIDIHPHASEVADRLSSFGISTRLLQGDGQHLPFADASLGIVVMVSTLSFIPDPAAALREAKRVLRPGGRLVALVARALPFTDQMWGRLSGRNAGADFGRRRQQVRAAITAELPVTRRQRRPYGLPPGLAPYELVVADKPLGLDDLPAGRS